MAKKKSPKENGHHGPSSSSSFVACLQSRSLNNIVLLSAVAFLIVQQMSILQRPCQTSDNEENAAPTSLRGIAQSFAGLNLLPSVSTSANGNAMKGILEGHYDVCIAGAGLSGAVLAERYASQLGAKVLVVEKRNHIGGNCYDYIDKDTGVRVSQYGAHLFHTIYEDVWDYVQKFGPWTPYEHKVRGIVNGKVVPIPVNIETVNTLFDLNIQSEQEMDQWLQKEQIPNSNPQNSEEVALSRVGQRLYDLIFKPYTKKQWDKYPVELGPEVLSRIPVRNNFDERYFSDPHQALPTNGYTSLFENMFKSQHITVLTETDYFQIRDKVKCGKHYFSGPIDAYFAHHNLPKLEYRSLSFERVVAKNTKFFQPAFVINHPQDNDNYTRIVEYKHLFDQSHLPHTVYFIERSSDVGEPYYPVPNPENKDLYKQYQNLAKEEEQMKNVSFVGRLANYKYFNMDQAIKNALDLFTKDTGIAYEIGSDSGSMAAAPDDSKVVISDSKAVASDSELEQANQLDFTPAVASNVLLPDWRQAVDCSTYDNMCGLLHQLEKRYKPYPFPYGNKIKNEHLIKYAKMTQTPLKWKEALAVDNSLDMPPPRPVEYIYPTPVPMSDLESCKNDATTLTWQQQVMKLLNSKLKKEETTGMVAFTISDIKYAEDMIPGVFEMNDKIVGFEGSFFMVAIDEATLDLACKYGHPVVAWPSATQAPADNIEELKHAVENTKFEISHELLKNDIDFLFYEMDVWFVQSPIQIIQHFHRDETGPKGDILLSSHQDCPMCANIGVYSVLANERSKEYFELCIQLAKESPDTHDQWIMGQMLLQAENARRGIPLFEFKGNWLPQPPQSNPPPITKPVLHGFWNSHEIVANERPVPTQNFYAIHPLASGPLQNPHGKKIMAKELGAWYGFDGPNGDGGYYRRTGERRRYLWMDGHYYPSVYSTVMSWDYGSENGLFHSTEAFYMTMATLLALARRTGRIFVMPKIIADHGVYYLWSRLDFSSVKELGIDYRETNFAHNPKSWQKEGGPYHSVARSAMGDYFSDGSMFLQYPSLDGKKEGLIKAWKFSKELGSRKALDAWWGAHTGSTRMDNAELLLVNPHFINNGYAGNLVRNWQGGTHKFGVAEKEIMAVYSKLRWCQQADTPANVIVFEWVVGRSTSMHDCYGKGKPVV